MAASGGSGGEARFTIDRGLSKSALKAPTLIARIPHPTMATDDHMTVTAVGIPSGAVSASLGKYTLENGQHIEDVVLGYSTYGTLNEVRSGS